MTSSKFNRGGMIFKADCRRMRYTFVCITAPLTVPLYKRSQKAVGNSLAICCKLALILAVFGWSFCTPATFANPAASRLLLAAKFEPPNDGAPGGRSDSGSRPGCPQSTKPFTALVPATNLGKTISERPNFWLYIPYQSGAVELVLKDENTKNNVYKTRFQVTKGQGIVSFRLPETAPPLENGKKYRWQFYFFCNPASESDYLVVDGVVMRESMSSTLKSQLETATPQQRIDLYAANGYWYDTLTELAQQRLANPQDVKLVTQWAELLRHPFVRLENLVDEPVVPCCTAGD